MDLEDPERHPITSDRTLFRFLTGASPFMAETTMRLDDVTIRW
jgi:hypothetical protein